VADRGFGLTNAAWSPGFAAGASLGAALAAALGDGVAFVVVASTCAMTAIVLAARGRQLRLSSTM
jgi:hypothetical protein